MDDPIYSGFAPSDFPLPQWSPDEPSGVGTTQVEANAWSADDDLFFNWDALSGPQNADPVANEDWLSWMPSDFSEPSGTLPSPTIGGEGAHHTATLLTNFDSHPTGTSVDTQSVHQGYTNVAQWLDGAHRPPAPCNHCRRYRLQCLILRTTSANPNPVTACSSCVALYRTCSLAQGEKRQASRFETTSPVLGHLHGVAEQADDTISSSQQNYPSLIRNEESKDSKQFVRKGARVLREWFYQNEECPYPSEEDKARLARETGFSRQRISTWFANARRRQKQKQQSRSSIRVHRGGSPMPINRLAMTPMERWEASPPDQEPVSEAAIQDALASTSDSSDGLVSPYQAESYSFDFSSGLEDASLASSLSSIGSLASEGLSDSASSAWSHQSSKETALQLPSRPRRHSTRQRRVRRRASEEGRYQCTFCLQSFQKKHDWARHEKSVHFPLDVWICTPDLNQLIQTNTSSQQCRFCDLPSPSLDHWESHDFRECSGKLLPERSFSRKDYLWQHLRKFHGCTRNPVPDLDAWRSSLGDVQTRCGFCGLSLTNWSTRADHLASHFKEGFRMTQWAGDWGFDSSALSNLRNAISPSERAFSHLTSG